MLNRIEDLLTHLNAQPSASEGFSAGTMYSTGMEFGLTCKEVKDIFLGKEKALGRGKYPAAVSAEIIEAAKVAPEKKEKKLKVSTREPKAARNTSTAVVEKATEKEKADQEARKKLIAKIAQRHAAENKVADELATPVHKGDPEADHTVVEELENILRAGFTAPI